MAQIDHGEENFATFHCDIEDELDSPTSEILDENKEILRKASELNEKTHNTLTRTQTMLDNISMNLEKVILSPRPSEIDQSLISPLVKTLSGSSSSGSGKYSGLDTLLSSPRIVNHKVELLEDRISNIEKFEIEMTDKLNKCFITPLNSALDELSLLRVIVLEQQETINTLIKTLKEKNIF